MTGAAYPFRYEGGEFRKPAGLAAWLALEEAEDVVEPALPVIDAHHHMWDRPSEHYMLPDLLADLDSGHDIRATVFVECRAMYRRDGPEHMRPLGEVEFVNGVAAAAASGVYGDRLACAAIVGCADLRHEAAGDLLRAQKQRGGLRFRGIRQIAANDPTGVVPGSSRPCPPDLMLRPDFRRGFAQLAALDLAFDAYQFHFQLADLADLARAFPGAAIVLNHVGGLLRVGPYAGREQEMRAQWEAGMRELAACPNVAVKLGGLGMPSCGFGLHLGDRPPSSDALAAAWRPFIETVIELFGAGRCMFESNFPVDRQSCSYRTMWNAFKKIAAGCSADEKRLLFHDTAAAVYRIGNAAP